MTGTGDQRPRFVVSTGRCGSTLLSRQLALHPSVLSLSEVFAALAPEALPARRLTGKEYWRLLSTPRPAWTRVLQAGLEPPEWRYDADGGGRFSRATGVPPILAVCLPSLTDAPDALYGELEDVVPRWAPDSTPAHHRALFQWLCRRLERTLWVERSGGSLLYAGAIAEAFPDARVVHLYRDGRETALSMHRHPFFRAQLVGGDPAALDPIAVRDADVPLERGGRRWSAAMLHGLRGLRRLPHHQVLHLDYARLVAAPQDALLDIAAFFALPGDHERWAERAAPLAVPQAPRWPGLEDQERTRLAAACALGEAQLQAVTAGMR